MSKYFLLGKFLREQQFSEVPMTFAEIERVTGVKLPPKAQLHRAWWSNSPSNNVMTKVWLDAGFRSEQVDMTGRKLVFKRVRAPNSGSEGTASGSPPGSPVGGLGESQRGFQHEAEPKLSERHPMIGALKGWLVVEPNYDLTQPAMPEWRDLLDRKHGPERPK
ncbi:MAG TPA: hypothetical protein VHT51_12250 [Micropepsaceae bacterium]|jgi:hypothetical protein|nr:hypothetical protein [Micropepsaceae bacterium]